MIAAPQLAVVIPTYRQPTFLAEAVLSATRSELDERVHVVIVNDGCPLPSTDVVAGRLSDMAPDRVTYLRQPNGGLSAARNTGIRFALDAFATVDAVFPLDSDNKLSTETLQRLWSVLRSAPDDVGWVYQDLTVFGARSSGWRTGAPFSMFRLAHENFSDAGALIRRSVFEQGVWYDESMRRGYEDWEFALAAGLQGFRGVHAPDTGFMYRARETSMLTDARSRHNEIVSYMRHKHGEFFRPASLVRLEHADMPRFAIVNVDAGTVSLVTDPLDRGRTITLAAYARRLARWRAEPEPKTTYCPPFTVFASGGWLKTLAKLRLLPGLLFTAQATAGSAPAVAIAVEQSDTPNLIELASSPEGDPCSSLLVVVTSELTGRAWPIEPSRLTLRLGGAIATVPEAQEGDVDIAAAGFVGAFLDAASRVAPLPGRAWPAMGSHSYFAERLHRDSPESPFPHRVAKRPLNVLFAVPWLTYAGVDKCVLLLAEHLARLGGRFACHLLTTHTNRVEVRRESLQCFDTVSFLPLDHDRRAAALERAMASADVVINAHSMAAYEALSSLSPLSRPKVASYLHVIDQDEYGMPWGYPLFATRNWEPMIDRFLVISEHLERVCQRNGVPLEKVRKLENAPTLAPPDRSRALAIAAEKHARTFSRQRPMKILFSGRLDRQKGVDRLVPIALALRAADVPFELQVVGSSVLGGSEFKLPKGTVALPPSFDPRRLAEYYTAADVMLLPSRWEGVPLAILEAMAYGAVIVATDVGAVGEIVRHDDTGFLVDPTVDAATIATQVAMSVRRLLDDPDGVAAIRRRAVEESMRRSWASSAASLAAAIEELVE